MNLSDGKITLRAVEKSDLDSLYRYENSPEKSETSFDSAPLSRMLLWRYIESYDADIFSAGQLRLMIVENSSGKTIGTVDITDFDSRNRRGFVGIYIDEKYRRCGYALAALHIIADYASGTVGMHQLVAQVAADNEASKALFLAAGYEQCAELKSWLRRACNYVDVILFRLIFD